MVHERVRDSLCFRRCQEQWRRPGWISSRQTQMFLLDLLLLFLLPLTTLHCLFLQVICAAGHDIIQRGCNVHLVKNFSSMLGHLMILLTSQCPARNLMNHKEIVEFVQQLVMECLIESFSGRRELLDNPIMQWLITLLSIFQTEWDAPDNELWGSQGRIIHDGKTLFAIGSW